MRRTVVYGSAAALITHRRRPHASRVGRERSDVPGQPGTRPRVRAGLHGAPPDLVLGAPDHRPLARRLDVPQGAPEFNKTFDVALHLGTLVAVVAYFWNDLIGYLVAWLRSIRRRSIETENERIGWLIVVASIPAAIIGAAGQSVIETRLGEPWQIAILMAVFALVLYWADRRPERKEVGEIGLKQGLLIGLAQSLALAPGVSRSGITISAGRFLGLTRDAAARLSFLLLVPIVLGAVVLKGYTDVIKGELPDGLGRPLRRRHDRFRRQRPARDQLAARLRPRSQLHGLRRLPRRTRDLHPARDRDRRQRRGFLMRVSVGDVELYVHERGEGRPLVALHGGPGLDGSVWFPGLDPIAAAGYRVLAVDHRANGRSDGGDPARWTVPQMADDVEALIGALGLEDVVVMGWSFGSFVAQSHMVRHGSAAAYVLMGTIAEPGALANVGARARDLRAGGAARAGVGVVGARGDSGHPGGSTAAARRPDAVPRLRPDWTARRRARRSRPGRLPAGGSAALRRRRGVRDARSARAAA